MIKDLVFIISSHTNNLNVIDLTRKSIESIRKYFPENDIILVSHAQIPKELESLVEYSLFTRKYNEFLTHNFISYFYTRNNDYFLSFNIKNFENNKYHGIGVLSNFINAAQLGLYKYKFAVFMNYDIILNNEVFYELIEKINLLMVNNYKKAVFYESSSFNNAKSDFLITFLFISEIEFFIKNFKDFINKQNYLDFVYSKDYLNPDKDLALEILFYQKLKENIDLIFLVKNRENIILKSIDELNKAQFLKYFVILRDFYKNEKIILYNRTTNLLKDDNDLIENLLIRKINRFNNISEEFIIEKINLKNEFVLNINDFLNNENFNFEKYYLIFELYENNKILNENNLIRSIKINSLNEIPIENIFINFNEREFIIFYEENENKFYFYKNKILEKDLNILIKNKNDSYSFNIEKDFIGVIWSKVFFDINNDFEILFKFSNENDNNFRKCENKFLSIDYLKMFL